MTDWIPRLSTLSGTHADEGLPVIRDDVLSLSVG